jgi:hypothetical protein
MVRTLVAIAIPMALCACSAGGLLRVVGGDGADADANADAGGHFVDADTGCNPATCAVDAGSDGQVDAQVDAEVDAEAGPDADAGADVDIDAQPGVDADTADGSSAAEPGVAVDGSDGQDAAFADGTTDATNDAPEDSGVDAEAGSCSTGAVRCLADPFSPPIAGPQPQVCVGGQWQNNGAACSPYGPTPACSNGSCLCSRLGTACSGNGVRAICLDNDYYGSVTPCVNQACINGTCYGVCTPGATQCSGNAVQTCSVSGLWGTGVACASSQSCSGGVCVP